MQHTSHFPSGIHAGLAADDLGRSDDRPPLVLLHGLTFDRRMWRPALAELESIDPGRRVLAFDLPGHGDTPDAPPYSIEAIVERVRQAIVEAHLESPVLVGHSASAGTAVLYAAHHPTRGVISVEGTLQVAGFASMARSLEPAMRGPGFDDAWSRISAGAFRTEQVSQDVRDFVRATSHPRQEIVLGYWQDLFERNPQDLEDWIAREADAVRESGVPCVFLLGEDPSPADVAWLRTNLPDARTEVWPDSGHFPHLAHPRRFAELLAEFSTRVGATLPTLVGQ